MKILKVVLLLAFSLHAMQENEQIDLKKKVGCMYQLTHCLYISCSNATEEELQKLPQEKPAEVVHYIFNKQEQAPLMQPEKEVALSKTIVLVTGCGCALALTLGGIAIGAALA